MAFSTLSAYLLMTLAAVILTVITLWLMYRVFKIRAQLLFVCLLPGVLTAGILKASSFDIIIVEPGDHISHYLIIGHPVYTSADSQKISIITRQQNDVYIINTTDHAMAIQRLQYTAQSGTIFPFGTYPEIIPPHRTYITGNIPDIFPDETVPEKVPVSESSNKDWREWLRRATPEEVSNATYYRLVPEAY